MSWLNRCWRRRALESGSAGWWWRDSSILDSCRSSAAHPARPPPACERLPPLHGGAPAFASEFACPTIHLPATAHAFKIARALLDGFDRHYRLFSETNRAAKQRFEQADWHGQQRAMRERIEFYDQRVHEAKSRLQTEFAADALPMEVWQQVKLLYIGLLVDHRQPELAETFFNSVTTKILHRSYFHNDFIFVRPAISTSYIEIDEALGPPTYRVYYPTLENWRDTWVQLVRDFDLQLPFEDLERDAGDVVAELQRQLGHAAAARQFPDPGAVEPVLPQQGRLRRRQDHQRRPADADRAAAAAHRRRQAGDRHRAATPKKTW